MCVEKNKNKEIQTGEDKMKVKVFINHYLYKFLDKIIKNSQLNYNAKSFPYLNNYLLSHHRFQIDPIIRR